MTARARPRLPARFGPLAVTSVADTAVERGWTLKQALDLLAQGYPVDHVVQVTGYDRRWVTAHARAGRPAD